MALCCPRGDRAGDGAAIRVIRHGFSTCSRYFSLALEFNASPSHLMGIALFLLRRRLMHSRERTASGMARCRSGSTRYFWALCGNLLLMTVIRTILVGGLTAFALRWLTQLLEVMRGGGGADDAVALDVVLQPRALWDNSLTVPTFSQPVLAGYLQFVRSHAAWAICLAIVMAALTCLVHLIAVPFLAVLLVHALVFKRDAVWRLKWPLMGTIVVMLLVSAPYLHYLTTFHGSSIPEYSSKWQGWIFSLFGAQHMTAWKVGYFLEQNLRATMSRPLLYAFRLGQLITRIAFLVVFRGNDPGDLAVRKGACRFKLQRLEAFEHACLIGLATIATQTVFDGDRTRVVPPALLQHHVDRLCDVCLDRDRSAVSLVRATKCDGTAHDAAYTASLVFCLAVIRWQLIRDGGGKGDHYNAILGDQIEVAREVDGFSSQGPIDMRVTYWNDRKDTFPVLCELLAAPQRNRRDGW